MWWLPFLIPGLPVALIIVSLTAAYHRDKRPSHWRRIGQLERELFPEWFKGDDPRPSYYELAEWYEENR